MLTALLLAAPLAASPVQDRGPTPEEVKAAVAALEEAFKKGASADRVAAIEAGARVPDAEVVAWIERGLKDREAEVQKAAIEGLRFLRHPAALEALHGAVKRNKKLLEDEELGGALLKAVAQHGSESSIALLADSPFRTRNHAAIQARILGLANIRSKRSVEELMALMQKVGRVKVQPYMGEFRLALVRLSGADQGKSVDLWVQWWNDAKKTLEVSKEPPLMKEADQRRWDAYWGNPQKYERGKRRGDRGGDRGGRGGGG